MVEASRMAARTLGLPPQRGHFSKSTWKTRLSSWAQRIRRREGFGCESNIHPVQHEHVEVKVKIDGAAKKNVYFKMSILEKQAMSISMKDLRYKTKEVIQSVKRGNKPVITYHGRPLARIILISTVEKKSFNPIGFGMWKNRGDLKDVNQWLDEQRKPRFSR